MPQLVWSVRLRGLAAGLHMSLGRGICLFLLYLGFSASFPLLNSMMRPRVLKFFGAGIPRHGAPQTIAPVAAARQHVCASGLSVREDRMKR